MLKREQKLLILSFWEEITEVPAGWVSWVRPQEVSVEVIQDLTAGEVKSELTQPTTILILPHF